MTEWQEVKSDSGIWIPTGAGDSIEGVVLAVLTGMYGLQLSIETKPGFILLTPSHKALQSRIIHFKVEERIKIVYDGAELPKVKGQQGVRLYRVFHDIMDLPIQEEKVA